MVITNEFATVFSHVRAFGFLWSLGKTVSGKGRFFVGFGVAGNTIGALGSTIGGPGITWVALGALLGRNSSDPRFRMRFAGRVRQKETWVKGGHEGGFGGHIST